MSKVFKKIKKVVKKVISSPLGKIALGAAAIYTGGAALGAWGGGSAAASSAAVGTAAGTSVSSSALLAAQAGTTAGITTTKVASSAFSLGKILSVGSKAISAIGAINTLSGLAKSQVAQDYAPLIAATRRAQIQQQQSLDQQKEMISRQEEKASKQEEEFSAQLAAQKRAIQARRSGRGSLAFTGPVTGLKTTFGG